MEYKNVILSVLIMSLVLAQIQVEATKVCCRTRKARFFYKNCRKVGGAEAQCARASGCEVVDDKCPSGYPHDILKNSGDDTVNEFCKLGCASSVCDPLTILQDSDATEIMNKCTDACSTLCTKGSMTTVETA